jgi:uncharacterized protein (TIGR03083 family)
VTERDFDWYCERIETETARLGRDLVSLPLADDAARPVLTCPGWTVADLIGHTGMVHRWAERIIRTRATERVDQREIDATLPEHLHQYADWLTAGASELTETLRAAGPDAACWAWGADHHARWWARRALHETIVHRSDVVFVTGHEPVLDSDDAADGIDELLANLPYGRRSSVSMAELPTGGETLHLHATDSDGEWMIMLTPDGMAWERGHGQGDVAVRGQVADLLLLVYGRLDPGHVHPEGPRLQIFGNRDLLTTWLTKTAL